MQEPDLSPRPPGLRHRLGALVYDAFLLAGILFLATAALLPVHGGLAFKPNNPLYTLYLLAVAFLFYGWFWTRGGQTLGMRAWKIALLSKVGGRVSWKQAALRFLAAFVSLGAFGLGFFWAWIDKEKRCWHDIVSNTRLVRLN